MIKWISVTSLMGHTVTLGNIRSRTHVCDSHHHRSILAGFICYFSSPFVVFLAQIIMRSCALGFRGFHICFLICFLLFTFFSLSTRMHVM